MNRECNAEKVSIFNFFRKRPIKDKGIRVFYSFLFGGGNLWLLTVCKDTMHIVILE